jgi:acyl-CoA reductase-like NAD-dependent aldehyde dehydrogenase
MSLVITNPATEEAIFVIESDTPQTVAQKFARAKAAQKEWAARPLTERLAIFRNFRAEIEANAADWAKITTSEVGKPIRQSHNEIKGLLNRLDFFLENTEKALATEQVLLSAADSLEERISHEPLGVIANISAWNYPYFVGSNVFIPALLAGNAVLYKPSEFATLTGNLMVESLHDAGVPEDVMIPIIGEGKIGSELLKQPVNGVFFTGSYGTGVRIAEQVASKLVRLQLELGGKDPVYIAEDVDVAAAADATSDGAFYNNGQSCCAVERIYVHRSIHDRFVEAFLKCVRGFVLGDPTDEKTYLGPLTRKAQIEVLERQIADAVAKGAKVLTGGKRVTGRKGYFFEPTVLVNVNSSMEIMREESFGPVIGIEAVADDAEAILRMNDTAYGLTAGVYTRGRVRAEKLLAQVNAGSAYWNCCDRVSPRLPWSGRGHSGVGLTLSHHGIRAFTQTKGWHLRG